MRRGIAGVFLVLGAAQLWQGGWIHAKARLAQFLLEDAWQRTLSGQAEVRPWSWADTWPVARLLIPALGAEMIVLDGASGRVIAFAPGRLHGSSHPSRPGPCVIAGHRDTHFAVLKDLEIGDSVVLEDAAGVLHRYRVNSTAVVDQDDADVLQCGEEDCLILVTCWPFDAIHPGGRERYVVWAVRTDPDHRVLC